MLFITADFYQRWDKWLQRQAAATSTGIKVLLQHPHKLNVRALKRPKKWNCPVTIWNTASLSCQNVFSDFSPQRISFFSTTNEGNVLNATACGLIFLTKLCLASPSLKRPCKSPRPVPQHWRHHVQINRYVVFVRPSSLSRWVQFYLNKLYKALNVVWQHTKSSKIEHEADGWWYKSYLGHLF